MYHRVVPASVRADYALDSLALPCGAFEEEVAWLAEHCVVLGASEWEAKSRQGHAGARPLIVATFDDGYWDNYKIVAPILERHGLRGTFFVTSGFVVGGEPLWFDVAAEVWQRASPAMREELVEGLSDESKARMSKVPGIAEWMEALKRARPEERRAAIAAAQERAPGRMDADLYRPMTREQVADLYARGHEIGSHTVSHPILTQLDDDELRRELVESKATLEDWIGGEVRGFCYPNGDFDERVKQAVIDAGYRYACTTRPGMNRRNADPMLLKRMDITPHRVLKRDGTHDLLGFRAEICGWRHLCRRLTFR